MYLNYVIHRDKLDNEGGGLAQTSTLSGSISIDNVSSSEDCFLAARSPAAVEFEYPSSTFAGAHSRYSGTSLQKKGE